ncbi:MAG: hypothetical protein KDB53_21040, partial [Planctomycetes bacterium]|nr:hypothetical protein [Planctomycetota bacterium]
SNEEVSRQVTFALRAAVVSSLTCIALPFAIWRVFTIKIDSDNVRDQKRLGLATLIVLGVLVFYTILWALIVWNNFGRP